MARTEPIEVFNRIFWQEDEKFPNSAHNLAILQPFSESIKKKIQVASAKIQLLQEISKIAVFSV